MCRRTSWGQARIKILDAGVVVREKRPRRLLETGQVARHRPHEFSRRVPGRACALLAGCALSRFVDELAQGHGHSARLRLEPFPVPRQKRYFAAHDSELRSARPRTRLVVRAAGRDMRMRRDPRCHVGRRAAKMGSRFERRFDLRRSIPARSRRGRDAPWCGAGSPSSSPEAISEFPANAVYVRSVSVGDCMSQDITRVNLCVNICRVKIHY